MYDRVARFKRATAECDQDWSAFGQGVIQARYVRPKNGGTPHLHHRCWHLRDVVWVEDEFGNIVAVYRKWHPSVHDVVAHFGDKAPKEYQTLARTKPFETVELWHCFLSGEIYDNLDGVERVPQPWVQFYFDPKHDAVLEQTGSWVNEYVIPRWETVSGSQYAYSPATVAALPDGRLIQNVTLVLLEAGQKTVSPPMIGVKEAFRSDFDIQAGGFSAIDPDFEHSIEEALKYFPPDAKGLNFGMELVKDIREQMTAQFFLNKLNLPSSQTSKEMTAYEVGQRVQEYIRNALPLMEPVEDDYNGQLCETDMLLILHNEPQIRRTMPKSLMMTDGIGDFGFVFESPLRDAVDKAKVGEFTEALQIIAGAVPHDESAGYLMDFRKATREALEVTVDAAWMRGDDTVDKMAKNAQAAAEQQKLLALMQQGGKAAQSFAAAGSDAADAMTQLGPA
jgi:hypothetical protein